MSSSSKFKVGDLVRCIEFREMEGDGILADNGQLDAYLDLKDKILKVARIDGIDASVDIYTKGFRRTCYQSRLEFLEPSELLDLIKDEF
jgi:hypothetical protein